MLSFGGPQLVPSGIPPIPAEARQIIQDKRVRRRAEDVLVLYMPEVWAEVDLDPAVVVRWHGRSDWHCLAVWGGDRAQIEEFMG